MATATRSSSTQHWENFLNGFESAFNWPKTFILFYSVVFLETYYENHTLLGCTYASLLGYPMYIALLVINGKFYSKVAEKSLQIQNKNQSNASAGDIANAIQSMATTIYTTIFYINCGVFAALLRSIPVVGTLLSLLMNCLIMAYYCFEYRWVYLGWSLEKRLTYIEQHWSFFLGFGVPITVLTFFLSTLRSGALFALFYPSYVIMAFLASPKSMSPTGQPISSTASSNPEWMLPNKIPAFAIVRQLNKLVTLLVKLIGGVRVQSVMSESASTTTPSTKKQQ
ncbi:unnamed protein product [Cunninghamella echinulata]